MYYCVTATDLVFSISIATLVRRIQVYITFVFQVQVVFRSRVEVVVQDLPLLRCQVIEPNISDGGEIIASIPIKLTARSVFSKYNIFPSSDINFGPMVQNSKKARQFAIENKGEFDFKVTVGLLCCYMLVFLFNQIFVPHLVFSTLLQKWCGKCQFKDQGLWFLVAEE